MTQYTAVPTKSTGNTFQAADWNTYVRDNLDAVAKAKLGWVYKNATQSIANVTAVAVTWPASQTLIDVGLVSNTLVPTYAGIYSIGATIQWASNATGYRLMYLRVNSSNVAEDKRAAATGTETSNRLTCFKFLAAGDVVDVVCQQSSGGALNLGSSFGEFQMNLISW